MGSSRVVHMPRLAFWREIRPVGNMPRDEKRRSRRSLPSALERNLSLRELLGDDAAKRHAKRRQSLEQQQQAALQSLNAYFAMIDQTELKVEQAAPEETSADTAAAGAVSDSELVRPTAPPKSTQRTVRRRNLKDAKLQADYRVYCEATGGAVKPLSIREFARSIEPKAKSGMYDGILDICTA